MGGWHVESQRDTTKLMGLHLVDGKEITIMFDGTPDLATVFVPAAAYNPDQVQAILENYVAKHSTIAGLSGTT